ncbi:MAG: hypothetical protein AB1491_01880 [Thermodesulfobacteriota bacterium]
MNLNLFSAIMLFLWLAGWGLAFRQAASQARGCGTCGSQPSVSPATPPLRAQTLRTVSRKE